MADTKVISSRDLVSQDSIQYIREQTLTLTLIEARPSTKMYVFFGSENVTHLCFPKGKQWAASTSYSLNDVVKYGRNYYIVTTAGISGSTAPTHTSGVVTNGSVALNYASKIDITTDSIGQAVIDFNIPRSTFNTGNYDIIITDSNNLSSLNITGNVNGSAKTLFSANGTIEIYQPRQISITTVQRTVNVQQDPLAQSFFTYGLNSGIFVSSIDVYFSSKDEIIPVSMELRNMENGYPSPLPPESSEFVSVVDAKNVNISSNAAVATKFTFDPPVYLKQDGDFCFVLRSNSNNYNVFTSRMGETSIEDGRKIFEQPYIGSVFKSENNITWTAEQFEDIKFTIYKANFGTNSSGTIKFKVDVPPIAAYGDQFTTTSGSSLVRYTHPVAHGLTVDSLISIQGQTGATYNGIPNASFSGSRTVTSVIDENTVEFQAAANATSTGNINSSNILSHVFVYDGGINYSSSDTITISGGGGSNAAVTPVIVDGVIKSVVITNVGSGYTSIPSITINTTTGSGASLAASITAAFSILVNKPMTGFTPNIDVFNFDTSKTICNLTTTTPTYGSGKTYQFEPNISYLNIKQDSLVASSVNEQAQSIESSVITIDLSTDDPDVSPIISLSELPTLDVKYTSINDQPGETISATASSGTVQSISVTDAGTGYTVTPIVTISAPNLSTGVQATATAVLTGTAITGFNITNAGSGYTSTPSVVISRANGDTTGTGAAAQAVLTQFNTELLPSGGNANARYITKKIGLQLVSTGIRVLSNISSMQGSSVDWYIRTSLSGSNVVHETQNWRLIPCDIARNKSSFDGDVYEYEFKLDDIPSFDTYELKCVLTAEDPTKSPIVYSYRAVTIA